MSDSPTTGRSRARERPAVAVVMPFAGTPDEALAALGALAALRTRERDAVVLADNSGTAPAGDPRVVPAPGERSPAHARNAGAAAAAAREAEWLLFLDADVTPDAGLLDAFFAGGEIAAGVGAIAGEVRPAPVDTRAPVAARYGAARNFLDSGTHLAHPFRPRVASANLLVRRAAFDAVGGFTEGIRTAEDTDLSWRLQEAGWTLALAPGAVVEHAYRPTLRGLAAQWRAYAAGRAWLARRYPGFTPQPALVRLARRLATSPRPAPDDRGPAAPGGANGRGPASRERPPAPGPPIPTATALAIDVALGVEELVGLLLPNRPRRTGPPAPRAQAASRPPGPVTAAPDRAVDYREDDGVLERLFAVARLALVAPRAIAADRRRPAAAPASAPPPSAPPPPAPSPSLRELAPAALRLRADPRATVAPSEDPAERPVIDRLHALGGRGA